MNEIPIPELLYQDENVPDRNINYLNIFFELLETREDILFLRHGIIKEKCAYAPMPLLNTSPIDINQFESLREAHEIRNFNNLDHFQQSLKFIENLNSLSLKDQTEIDLEKEMQLKLDSTIRPCASAIDGVKPKWPKFLPVPLYKPAKPSQTVEPVSRRESAVRRTFRRIFSNHDASTADEYSQDELYYGPVVSMFTFYPTRGKKDICIEINQITNLINNQLKEIELF